MKRFFTPVIAVIFLSLVSCTASSIYDTSTPAKFISSLGQIGLQPKDENPVPHFYSKEDAASITQYDEMGQKTLEGFGAFKTAFRNHFPNKIVSENQSQIKLSTQTSFVSNLSFSLSVSIIRNQLQERLPDDYEFVSASEINGEGVIDITYKLLGNQRNVEVKREKNKLVMFLTQESSVQLKKMVDFFEEAQTFFAEAISALESEKVNDKNFEEIVTDWNRKYMGILNKLN